MIVQRRPPARTELTFEQVDELLAYDPETGELRWKINRGGTARAGSVAGGDNGVGYWTVKVRRRTYKAHRLAYLLMTRAWPPAEIDHKNRKRADNRWDNLRVSSRLGNMHNTGLSPRNTSGYPGVDFRLKTKKWRAQIKYRGRKIHLGSFDTPDAAAAAYSEAKKTLALRIWKQA